MPDDEAVDIRTGLFGLKLTGPSAILMLLFFATLANGALTMWEHFRRELEHDNMICIIRLNLYIHTLPKNSQIDWADMPSDLYNCIPRFLYERGRGDR